MDRKLFAIVCQYVIIFQVLSYSVFGYKEGAPAFTCNTLSPGHGVGAQTSPSPYEITTSKLLPSERIRIKLSSTTKDYFTGYMIKAKLSSNDAFGSFVAVPQESKTLNCNDQTDSAATHTTNSKKRSVELDWEAPQGYEGTAIFHSTFVYNYSTFWTGIESLPVEITKRSTGSSQSLNQKIEAAVSSVYENCDVTKNCVSYPDNCLTSKKCDAIVSVFAEDGSYQFEMFAKNSKYVSFGLSDDSLMGGDSVVECVYEDEQVNYYRSWNVPNRKSNQRSEDKSGVTVVNKLYTDGTIYCKLKMDPVTTISDKKFDLNKNEFFLLLAAGSKLKANGEGIGHHDFFSSSKVRKRLSEVGSAPVYDSFYDGCDTLKTCFGVPDGCVSMQNCKVVTAISVQGTKYVFNMKGQNAMYVAIGLSEDQKMGGDAVFECVRNQANDNKINAYMSWNEVGKQNNYRIRQNYLTLLNGSYIEGMLQCSVLLQQNVFSVEGTTFDVVNEKYFLLLASGSNVSPPDATSIGNVGFHDIAQSSAGERRVLSDVSALKASSKLLLHLHGSFMIASWIGLTSVGIVLARYFKQTWVGSSCCGKDIWFAWHRFFMFLVWLLTIVGVVLIYIDSGGFVTGPGETHALLGIATAVLAFIQPICAAFRPSPDSSRRPIFNWFHWLVGNAAHIVALATIFLAVDLGKAELPRWTDWILVTYVVYYVLMHLLLSISGCLSDRSGGIQINAIQMKDMNSPRNVSSHYERRKDAAYSGFRKFMLTIHFLVILAFSVLLIWLIVYAPV